MENIFEIFEKKIINKKTKQFLIENLNFIFKENFSSFEICFKTNLFKKKYEISEIETGTITKEIKETFTTRKFIYTTYESEEIKEFPKKYYEKLSDILKKVPGNLGEQK
jgi:hypothetical protein